MGHDIENAVVAASVKSTVKRDKELAEDVGLKKLPAGSQ